MIAAWQGYHLNVWLSLAIITVLLVAAIVFSERKNRRLELERRGTPVVPPSDAPSG